MSTPGAVRTAVSRLLDLMMVASQGLICDIHAHNAAAVLQAGAYVENNLHASAQAAWAAAIHILAGVAAASEGFAAELRSCLADALAGRMQQVASAQVHV